MKQPLLSFLLFLAFTFNAISQGVQLNWAHGFADMRGEGHNILSDDMGNVYVNGWVSSGPGDINPAAGDTALVGNGIYLSKYTSSGNYLWSFTLGSSLSAGINLHSGICFDESGNIVIAGSLTGRIDFDPSADSLIVETANGMLFVAKYTPAGALLWANTFVASGSFNAGLRGVTTDEEGNIYIGAFVNANGVNFDFDPSANTALLTTAPMGVTFFMAKYSTTGNYLWAKVLPGTTNSNSNRLTDIAIGSDGNLFITGEISGARDFDPSADSLILTPTFQNTYLAKYDTAGNLLWANLLNGNRSFCRALEADQEGYVFIAGEYSGTVDFDGSPDSATMTTAAVREAFVAKYDLDGSLVWAKPFETMNDGNDVRGMKLDNNGYLYISGYFSDTTDFDPSPAVATLIQSGAEEYENYIAKLDEHGNYIWAIGFANSRFSLALDVATDADANVYTTGVFRGTADFDPSGNNFLVTGNANTTSNTIFIAKYGPCFNTTANAAICLGDTIFASTKIITEAGSHTVSFIGSNGCDSVVTFSLTVNNPPDATVAVSGNVISAVQMADSYQWFDCDAGMPLPGDTFATYTPLTSGNYAVELTLNNCTALSACENIILTGVKANPSDSFLKVFPNPTSGAIYIRAMGRGSLLLMNELGQQVAAMPLSSAQINYTFNVNPGIYFLQAELDGYFYYEKVIVIR